MNYEELDTLLSKPYTRRGLHVQCHVHLEGYGRERFVVATYPAREYDCEYRKVNHNTYVERRSPFMIAFRYHVTDIVEFFKNGAIRIHTDNYMTLSTRDRLNQALYPEYRMWQRNLHWWIEHRSTHTVHRMRENMVFLGSRLIERGGERMHAEKSYRRYPQDPPARCHVYVAGKNGDRECGLFLSPDSRCAHHGYVMPGEDGETLA